MQLLTLILALLLLPAAAIVVWERLIFSQVPRAWAVYRITGMIGTPIHELSHAIGCFIFGLRIKAIALYQPDPRSGRMGYVSFMYNPGSIFQQFGCLAQGAAPMIVGGMIVSLVLDGGWQAPVPAQDGQFWMWLYLAGKETVVLAWHIAQQSWVTALVVLLLIVISMHAIPSMQDVRVGLRAFFVLLIPTLLLVLAVQYAAGLGIDSPLVARLAGVFMDHLSSWLWWLLYAACSVVALAVTGSLVFILLPALCVRVLRGSFTDPSSGDDVAADRSEQ